MGDHLDRLADLTDREDRFDRLHRAVATTPESDARSLATETEEWESAELTDAG